MSILNFMTSRCPDCKQSISFTFWPDGSIRKHDHWFCPFSPPGPPDPPREYRQGAVRFVESQDE